MFITRSARWKRSNAICWGDLSPCGAAPEGCCALTTTATTATHADTNPRTRRVEGFIENPISSYFCGGSPSGVFFWGAVAAVSSVAPPG